MKRNQPISLEPDNPNEIKTRIPVWLYPSTLDAVDRGAEMAGCKSRSEYLEKAALFYAGYVSGQDAIAYLPPALVSALRGTIQDTENRICRLLFKLAVEQDMTSNITAYLADIDLDDVEHLRGQSVRRVKRTNGDISFEDALRFQKGL